MSVLTENRFSDFKNKFFKPEDNIAAIRDFQYDRVKYWVGKDYVTGDTDYLTGIVNKNNTDLTFKILSDYTRYTATFTLDNVAFRYPYPLYSF